MPDAGAVLEDIKRFFRNQEEVYAPFETPLKAEAEESAISEPETAKVITEPEMSKPAEETKTTLETCTTLEELRAFCGNASELRTDLENTNLVFGVGNPNADLMLIGEAPGANEDRLGEPFVGRAGQLLNKILAAINFNREDVYIANILKHRPPDNRDPLPEERKRSLPYLERQIDIIQPKIILCLGRISAHTLLDTNEPMKNLRGRFHTYRDKYELTLTYHPAALLRNPNWKRGAWEDVQMVRGRYDELGCKP